MPRPSRARPAPALLPCARAPRGLSLLGWSGFLLLACEKRAPEAPASTDPAAVVVASAQPGISHPPPHKRREVRRTGPDLYEVPESLFRRLLRERGAIDRHVWAEPVEEEGKLVGYRLEGIRPDSIPAQLGLHNEDLIELVNGALPDTPAALDGAQASAERTGHVTVLLTRLGSSRILQYQITDD